MGQVNATDEWLYKYMPVVDEAIIRELEDNTDYGYQFTDKFERRMRKLIRREAHPWIGILYGLLKKAAVLFVCAASALVVITMSVEAYRVRFVKTVKSVMEDRILYLFFADKSQETIQYKEPGYVPEGYRETERIMSERWFSVTYMDEDGKVITWDQFFIQDGQELTLDTEYERQVIKEIKGSDAVISLYLDGSAIVYYELESCVFILTADDFNFDDICLMLENIGKNKKF